MIIVLLVLVDTLLANCSLIVLAPLHILFAIYIIGRGVDL